jgi:hypothetical protein
LKNRVTYFMDVPKVSKVNAGCTFRGGNWIGFCTLLGVENRTSLYIVMVEIQFYTPLRGGIWSNYCTIFRDGNWFELCTLFNLTY